MTDLLDRLRTALADRYAIERELGSGGMATVYLAQDVKHERQVALKVLRPELAAALGPERFLHEIRIAANLHHPHILPLYDSGEAEGFLYYVMPYVEGESLRERLDREKQLPIDGALKLAREVADALSYAHSHGVIHRDIKPENILLESGHAVVADFGIACAVDAAGGERLTRTGIALGTPAYMSPEQARGEKDLDGRSDLYALGCVLHEMLAGQPPYTGPTAESIVHQHLSADVPPITVIRPSVPGWVAAALERSLAKTPADRFNPVAQFGEAISPRMSVTATPTSGAPPLPTRKLRRRIRAGAGTLLGALVVATVGWWLTLNRDGAVSDQPPPNIRIAVLPFENLSTAGDQEYLSEGITQDLNTQLSKIEDFVVIAHGSARRVGSTETSHAAAATVLGVDYLVDGSVSREGERVRITVRLIDPASDEQLWAEDYDRTLSATDIFAVRREVALQVAAALNVTLTANEHQRLAALLTESTDAYNAYLLGRFHWNKRTVEDIKKSASYFEQAIAADSNFALAWSGFSDALGLTLPTQYGGSDLPAEEVLVRSERAARRAIAIDPSLAEGHTSLAHVLTEQWRWAESEREYQRAIALSPGYATVHHWYSVHLVGQGRVDQAVQEIMLAQELDPVSHIIGVWVGLILDASERTEEARDQYEHVVALHPGVWRVHLETMMHYLRARDFERAASHIRQWAGPDSRAVSAAGVGASGRSGEVVRRWSEDVLAQETRSETLLAMADSIGQWRGPDLAVLAGDRQHALAMLERWTIAPGYLGPALLAVFVLDEGLRGEPLYRQMLTEMGVSWDR